MNPKKILNAYFINNFPGEFGIKFYVYFLLLLFTIIISFYAFYERSFSRQKWNQAQTFANQVEKIRFYQSIISKKNKKSQEKINNPLSYLENQVEQSNLQNLTPVSNDKEERQYKLLIESVQSDEFFRLLKKFGNHEQVTTLQFTFERVSTDTNQFDARFRVRISK